MPEEIKGNETQGAPGAPEKPQEQEARPGQEDPQPLSGKGADADTAPKDEDFSTHPVFVELLKQKREANAEAQTYRKKMEALVEAQKKKDREAELAQMTEIDRLKAIAEEQATALAAERLKNAKIAKTAEIVSAAAELGFHKPSDAARLVDLSMIDYTDGIVDNAAIVAQLGQLVQGSPYLVKTDKPAPVSFGGEGSNPAPDDTGMPKPKLHDKETIQRLKQQSSEAMRNGKVAEAVRLYNKAWEQERGIKQKNKVGG